MLVIFTGRLFASFPCKLASLRHAPSLLRTCENDGKIPMEGFTILYLFFSRIYPKVLSINLQQIKTLRYLIKMYEILIIDYF